MEGVFRRLIGVQENTFSLQSLAPETMLRPQKSNG
jgi:hypothetical protein